MAEVTVNRLGEAAQLDNEYQSNHHYMRPELYERAPHLSTTAATIRAWGIVAGLFWLIASIFTWILAGLFCWRSGFVPSLDCVLMSWLARLATAAPVLIGIGAAGIYLWRTAMLTLVESWRGRITRDRYSNPVDAKAVLAPDWNAPAYFASAQQAEITMAPFKQLPAGLDSLSMSSPSGRAAAAAAEDADAGEPLALLPVADWLPWLTDDAYPMAFITGKTRSGKSTLADIVLGARVERGDQIAILDPHWSTKDRYGHVKWGGIAPLAKDVDEIAAVLEALRAEFEDRKRRMKLPEDHPDFVPELGFPYLTILLDEANEVYTQLHEQSKTKGLWSQTVRNFGSGGAKVNMHVILLAQSPNVEDLGMSGPMRNNFTMFALPDNTRSFIIKHEPDPQRRTPLLKLLTEESKQSDKPYAQPAAAYRGGQVQLLSREGLIQHRATSLQADVWESLPADDDADDAAVAIPPTIQRQSPQVQVSWLAANTKLSTRQIRQHVGCDYNLVVEITRKVRGPRGSALRARLMRIAT